MKLLAMLLLILVPDRVALGPVVPEPIETVFGMWHKDGVTIHVGSDLKVVDGEFSWSGDCVYNIEFGFLDVEFYDQSPGPWVGRYWIEGGKLVGWFDLACRVGPTGEPMKPTREVWTRTKKEQR